MKIEPNTTISHYKIVSEIGKGGMGEVYLAQDTKLERNVALKILPEEFSADSERMARFVREAKAASALNHQNIITIYEIGEYEGRHLIAMEYIDGETLTDYAKSKRLKFSSALDIAIQAASALVEAHAAGIVHRDIKPDNIMVRSNGQVKVLDFGIAKLSAGRGEKESSGASEDDRTLISVSPLPGVPASPQTTPGMIIGTANYMSPEQAKGTEIDFRSDIFSFGVVFYELNSGRLPFEGESPIEVIGSILRDEPKSLKGTNVPDEFVKVVIKCLRKNPDERYQNTKELLSHLTDIKQNLEFQDKLERTIQPHRDLPETQLLKTETADEAGQTTNAATKDENITIKRSSFSKVLAGLLVLLVFAAAGIGYLYFSSGKQIESIAVMPFVNESGNEDVEYLSDGMTESLINSLTEIPNLSVKARSSVFYYKGKNANPKQIGEELNVEAVLLGRIIQRGDDIKLNLELVDTKTLDNLWSATYGRKINNLVTLQSEIAKDVSSKLKSKLSGADEARVTKTSTVSPEAYQAYLRGRYYWNRRTSENIGKAIEQFKAAIDRDPNYALAFAGLADCYAILPEYAGTPISETSKHTRNYAARAIALDEQLGEPHAALGMVAQQLWQWGEAEKEYRRAIEINPNYATAFHWYSILLKNLGRYDEAAKMIERAAELDPLSGAIGCNISMIYQVQDNHEASVKNSLKMIELDPSFGRAYEYLGLSYLKLGRDEEAIKTMEKAVELTNRQNVVLSELGYVYGRTGRRTEALAVAKELESKFARKEAAGHEVAAVYSGLGEKDKAFEWLEKDFKAKDGRLNSFRWEIQFEPLRNDPRFKDLLKRMNLPEK